MPPCPRRAYLAAATGPDGRIYAIGGYYNGSYLTTVEAYTPGSNTWTSVAPMPTARYGLAAATGPDGRIYAIGGDDSWLGITNTVYAYTPGSNTWTTVASMPTARYLLAATTGPDGLIYAIGGYDTSLGVTNTVYAYTPGSDTWTTVASMPTSPYEQATTTGPDGLIYVIGGVDNSYNITNTVYAYTPGSNTWTTVASMPTARECLAAATGLDGRIYAIGGYGNSGYLNTVEALNFGQGVIFSTSTLSPGSYTITALYAPDNSNFIGSSSADLLQTVNQAGTTTTVTSSANPSVFGQTVTFTATVSVISPGTGTTTGTVTFSDGDTSLGTALVSGGQATYTTVGLSRATHAITAAYSGDSDFSGSSGSLTPTIITIAGNGTPNYSGDGGAASAAQVNGLSGVAVDASGNVYFADDQRIRKVAADTGIITTVAGNGNVGFSGDGGAATAAELYNPRGVAVDAAGNVYIVDKGNQRIREVLASTGIITTIAGNGNVGFSGDGGAATAAELYNPSGVAVDTAGNVYIADAGNNRIREVTAGTGIITTIAGNDTSGYAGDGGAASAATLFYPNSVAVDAAGNVYIADEYNNCIREVSASAGIITTIAGGGSNYPGDGGAATAAQLDLPSGVAVDAAGNVYIIMNNRVREVSASTGIITTIAGNDTSGYSGDGGAASAAALSSPRGVAVDACGHIYIADRGNYRIRMVSMQQTVNPASTSLTLASSLDPSSLDQLVMFSAAVQARSPGSGTPAGAVTFADGSSTLGTAPLVNGVATIGSSGLTVGIHSITAIYGGDGNFLGNTATWSQTVTRAATTTTVTSSINPSAPYDPLSLTATVSAVSPSMLTGSVTFLDGGFQIGTCPISNGTATFEIPFALTVRSHTITAVYTGDSNFAGSTSPALTQVVKQTTITTTSSALSASVFGQSVTLTASVSRSGTTLVPTGTLTFLDGGTVLGTGTVNGTGRATYTTTSLSVGQHVVTVVYGGDANYFGSTSDALSQTVNQAGTSTAMTSALNPAAAGQAITFTAVVGSQWSVVSGQWPSGVLTFQDGGISLGTATLTPTPLPGGEGSMATFSTTTLTPGRHTISVVYGGDSGFAGSTSAALTQTVLPVATISIPTTFSGGVGSSIAVPVNLDRSDSLEQADLAISYDTSRLEILSAGDIQPGTLTSTFDGFVANYDNTAGTIRLSTYRSSGALFGFGSGSLAIINFHIKASALPGAAIINLQAHVQTTTTVLHGRDATGNDLGNFTLQPAPSDEAGDALDGLVTVLPSTLTTVVSSLNPATVGQTVNFTATVSSSAGTPTGTVTFVDGSSLVPLAVSPLSNGTATYTTNGLTVGGHSITVVYGGDTGFPGSTSAPLIQTIQASTLRVTALTPTATGFQAVFDRLLDTSSLNLYDNSTGTLGSETSLSSAPAPAQFAARWSSIQLQGSSTSPSSRPVRPASLVVPLPELCLACCPTAPIPSRSAVPQTGSRIRTEICSMATATGRRAIILSPPSWSATRATRWSSACRTLRGVQGRR